MKKEFFIFGLILMSVFYFGKSVKAICGDDITYDGQIYSTVQIGSQCWFKDNLNFGNMVNGGIYQSNNNITEKYCYNNDENNCDIYGGLYKWGETMNYSVINGAQGICPTGWHVPTDLEWATLVDYSSNNSNNLKVVSPSWNGNDMYGFSVMPGGDSINGVFQGLGSVSYLWSSTVAGDTGNAWDRIIGDNIDRRPDQQELAFSVRCIADFNCAQDEWSCSDWSSCQNNKKQTRTCNKTFDCVAADTAMPEITKSCEKTIGKCKKDDWQCEDWSFCGLDKIQTRKCYKINNCQGGVKEPDVIKTCKPICTLKNFKKIIKHRESKDDDFNKLLHNCKRDK